MPTDAARPITFTVVTDSRVMALGFEALANDDSELRLLGASPYKHVMEILDRRRPDVLVIDHDSSSASAAALCDAVTRCWPSIAVLMISGVIEDGAVRASLEAGARGFVSKSADPAYLTAAIRALADGDGVLDPKVTRQVIEWARHPGLEVAREELSEREIEVLRLVSRGEPNKRIAKRLGLTENTVKTYLRRAYRKLNCNSRSAAAAAMAQRGLL